MDSVSLQDLFVQVPRPVGPVSGFNASQVNGDASALIQRSSSVPSLTRRSNLSVCHSSGGTQGFGMVEPSSWQPGLVQLENQRLREEIRATCATIKRQSGQLSELWATTQRVKGGGAEGTDWMKTVADLNCSWGIAPKAQSGLEVVLAGPMQSQHRDGFQLFTPTLT
eukprot:1643527-Amphidinium_carterae.1